MEKGVLRNDDIKFQKRFTEKLKEAYNLNPKKTLKYMEICTQELGYEVDEDGLLASKLKFLKIFRNERNRMFLYCGLIGLFGIFSFETFFLYYFGMAFFCAGTIINLFETGDPKGTLIFLFSHGLVGGVIMFFAHSTHVINYLPDSDVYLIMYVAALICMITGFMRNILVALSLNKMTNKSNVFLFYVAAFFILALLNIFVFYGVRF